MRGSAPDASAVIDERLIEAIHSGRLAAVAHALAGEEGLGDRDRELLDAAVGALRAIGGDGVAAGRGLTEALTDAGVRHRLEGPVAEAMAVAEPALQRIAIDVRVAEADAAGAVEVASRLGYRPWHHLHGAGWAAYRRLHPALALASETAAGHPVLLQVAWRDLGCDAGRAHQRRAAPLRRLLPSPSDLEATRLPAPLWPCLLATGPLSALSRRVRRRRRRADLGPYLPTPAAVVDALLDVAAAGPGDVVADLGCGDGRVLVRAAERGCRGIGVERDAALAAAAKANAAARGVGHLVEVVHGELGTFDPKAATVVVLFVSADALAEVLGELRRHLRPGCRVVAHEQAPVPVTADERRPVFTPGGVTVAHRWDL